MANRPIPNRNGKFKGGNKNERFKKNGIKSNRITKAKVQDARQKLIQKKRTTVVDARDILSRMSKTKDARSRLDRLREGRLGRVNNNNANVKVIGHSITQKTDRNGKITLSTNKPKNKTNLNVVIQKQLGLNASPTRPQNKKVNFKRNAGVAAAQRRDPKLLNVRKTIYNNVDLAPLDARLQRMERLYDASLYKWTKPDYRTASNLISTLEARRHLTRESVLSEDLPEYINNTRHLIPSGYIDLDAMEDEEMPLVQPTISLQGSSRISNIHSRLDSLPVQAETHGILGQPKTKVVVPAGHRIVVSNLQSTVTQDDIKELFEDIGQLLAARLVRPGVAEVIYKNLKDAQKAVDTYHNRQLDGQPMKCLLVNKRPLNHPTAPALTKTDSQGILAARKALAATNNSKLVPDIDTIHKVLFQRK